MTIGQIRTVVGNTLLQTFEPVLQGIGRGSQWIYDNCHLTDDVPEELKKEFEEYMKSAYEESGVTPCPK